MFNKLLILIFAVNFYSCSKSLNSGFMKRSSESLGAKPKEPGVCTAQKISDQTSIQGLYHSEIRDNFQNNSFEQKHFLTDLTGKKYELSNINAKQSFSIGDTIRVSGHLLSSKFDQEAFHVDSVQVLSSQINTFKEYDLKVLTVIMNFTNRVSSNIYSLTRAQQDLEKLKEYTSKNSSDQMKMNIDANNDGTPDAEIITINRGFNRSDCTPSLNQRVDVAGLLQNHNLSDYDTVIYIAANSLSGNDTTCGYGGVANVGQLGSGLNGRTHVAIPKFNVILHELGHTWGLGHSGRPGVTYAHKICPMGNSFDDDVTHFNAPKTKMLGLHDLRPELERTITDNGTYNIEAIGLGVEFTSDSAPRVMTIDAGGTIYYLEYRHPSGEDADMPSDVNSFRGINITTAQLSRGGVSSYQAILNTSNRVYNGSGVQIELVGNIQTSKSQVKLTFDNPRANPPYEGNKCESDKVNSSFKKTVKVKDGYEVHYSLTNQNNTECQELQFEISIESGFFELIEDQSIAVASGANVDVITKVKVKDGIELTKGRSHTGTIKATELGTKVENQEIDFSVTDDCL